MVSIEACTTKAAHRKFEAMAETLLKNEEAFVPPFPGSIVKYLSPKSAFHRRHGEIIPFIAKKDGRVVGRIAAIINRSHNEYYKDRTGFFGFFECENDDITAGALFHKAAETLRARGFATMRGPYNPSINDECGLLIEGFEKEPFIGLTWNPPYYQRLLEHAGFQDVCTLFGYELPLAQLTLHERFARITERIRKRSRMKLRPIKLEKLNEELKIIHEVYNCTLERNWGFVPISMEDLLFAADDMRAIADPGMILIAEQDGENAGVALSLPNFNELLALAKHTPRWLRPLHILWLMKTRKINSARQIVYGISPRFRDRGLHGWLMAEQFLEAQARFAKAELGWIEESNTEIMGHSLILGATHYRTWKIYERPLAA